MKTIFALWFALCLSASAALPGPAWLASTTKAAAPAGCTTAQISVTGAAGGSVAVGRYGTDCVATWFTTVGGFTCCKVGFWLAAVGSPTFNLTAKIYSDDGGSPSRPSTLLATSTGTVAASGIGGSASEVDFDFAGQALSASTKYWVVLTPDANDSSNYVTWSYTGGYTPSSMQAGAGCANWADYAAYEGGLWTFSP